MEFCDNGILLIIYLTDLFYIPIAILNYVQSNTEDENQDFILALFETSFIDVHYDVSADHRVFAK